VGIYIVQQQRGGSSHSTKTETAGLSLMAAMPGRHFRIVMVGWGSLHFWRFGFGEKWMV
jgi:hypothetical protein